MLYLVIGLENIMKWEAKYIWENDEDSLTCCQVEMK